MRNAFVVTQEGVYRHNIYAITEDYALAEKLAKQALAAEPDDYHTVEIWRGQMNVLLTEISPIEKCKSDKPCFERIASYNR